MGRELSFQYYDRKIDELEEITDEDGSEWTYTVSNNNDEIPTGNYTKLELDEILESDSKHLQNYYKQQEVLDLLKDSDGYELDVELGKEPAVVTQAKELCQQYGFSYSIQPAPHAIDLYVLRLLDPIPDWKEKELAESCMVVARILKDMRARHKVLIEYD